MINGGFGLVLDGTEDAEQKARRVLSWDVANGVSDRQHLPRLSPVQTADPPPSRKVCGPPAAAVSPPSHCQGGPPWQTARVSPGLFPVQPVSTGPGQCTPSRHCLFAHLRAQLPTLVCVLALYGVRGPIPEGPHIRA